MTWVNQQKAVLSVLGTEDALSFLTTENEEALAVEPTPGYFDNVNKSSTTWANISKS